MRFTSYLLVLGVLSVLTKLTLSEEINIYPSCSGRGSTCRTLASFSTSSRNVVLRFKPGNHQITRSKLFEDMTYWELKGSGVDVSNITCTNRYSTVLIKLSYATRAKISGLTILYCNVVFVSVTEIVIQNSDFLSLRDGLDLWTSNNVSIDQCKFNRYNWFSSTIIHFYYVNSFQLTRSELSNVNSGSQSSAVLLTHSFGYIGCSSITHITSGAAINLFDGSSIYVTNCTFANSSSTSIVHLHTRRDKVVIVSCIFHNCRSHGSKGAIIYAQTSASITVLACNFTEIRGPVLVPSNGATVDCNYPSFWLSPHNNLRLCERHAVGSATTCKNSSCSCKFKNQVLIMVRYSTCSPKIDIRYIYTVTYELMNYFPIVSDCDFPAVEVSLEQSEYIVSEGIGKSNRALQICAVARDTLFPVMADFSVQNGSAIGK